MGHTACGSGEAGENGGILCEMLEELAEYYKLQVQMKRFLKNISLYPLFLFSASLGNGSFIYCAGSAAV